MANPIASCAPAERLDGPSLEPGAHDARARERLEELPLERAHRLQRLRAEEALAREVEPAIGRHAVVGTVRAEHGDVVALRRGGLVREGALGAVRLG